MQSTAIGPTLIAIALTTAVSVRAMATAVAPPERAASAPASPHLMPGQMPSAEKKKTPPGAGR